MAQAKGPEMTLRASATILGSATYPGDFMDERTDVSAAFALRLSADILTALVVKQLLEKNDAHALIDDALAAMLSSHPEHEPQLREIAATLTTQVMLVAIDADRKRDRP
jgi:hypothetical protein